jgi:aspartyl/glutamyl-tRNA(Asn/Gln) amidotransferase C subunit
MAQPIDAAQIRHIAKLARLELSAEELNLFARQMGDILEYFRVLSELDTSSIRPLAHALPITNVVRDDEPRLGLRSEQALANAPERHGDFFRVPAVLDPAGGS